MVSALNDDLQGTCSRHRLHDGNSVRPRRAAENPSRHWRVDATDQQHFDCVEGDFLSCPKSRYSQSVSDYFSYLITHSLCSPVTSNDLVVVTGVTSIIIREGHGDLFTGWEEGVLLWVLEDSLSLSYILCPVCVCCSMNLSYL